MDEDFDSSDLRYGVAVPIDQAAWHSEWLLFNEQLPQPLNSGSLSSASYPWAFGILCARLPAFVSGSAPTKLLRFRSEIR